MAKLNLIETIETKLPTLTKTDGQLIVIRDNASLYVDLDGARIYISDWIDVSTDEERLAMLSPLSNKYYYVVETNKIWRYISGSWVLVTSKNYEDLNGKPQIEGVELVGNKTLADFGGKKQIRISWEDYQALSTEEQNNESIVYYIYDYPNNVVNASDISYDNVTSLLSSTNVQDAVDEVVSVRNVKTYSTLTQLGMSTDNTITEIMSALPLQSELLTSVGSFDNNLTACLPNGKEPGQLRFSKAIHDGRGVLEFTSYNNDRMYINRCINNEFTGWRKLVEQSEIDELSKITDVSDLITVKDNGTTTIASARVHKYGNRIKGHITFSYTGDTLYSLVLFDIDETIKPIQSIIMIGLNQATGNTYMLEAQTNSVIRTNTISTNDEYTSGQSVSVYIDWYIS